MLYVSIEIALMGLIGIPSTPELHLEAQEAFQGSVWCKCDKDMHLVSFCPESRELDHILCQFKQAREALVSHEASTLKVGKLLVSNGKLCCGGGQRGRESRRVLPAPPNPTMERLRHRGVGWLVYGDGGER